MDSPAANAPRERFGSGLGTLFTMIGVAVGLGNVWRLPYMVGRYGGAGFVLVYLVMVAGVGVPALIAEWTLGRETRRGTLGAFERGGLPAGRLVGWALFLVVVAATGYYTNVVGWVLFHALAQAGALLGLGWNAAVILPPETGFDGRSFGLQLLLSATVLGGCAWVLSRGLRGGIERASRFVIPGLGVILLLLIARSLTLEGAGEGVIWYLGHMDASAFRPPVLMAALGQAVFSLSLGGTFMVVYGSYLDPDTPLGRNAAWTAFGDAAAGLLAGLAIFPAVFALGLEPASGPGLLFSTLPETFARMPLGALFGALFFVGLAGAAFLSDIAALEVLVAGVCDALGFTRKRAIRWMVAAVFVSGIAPMINLQVFVPWDLTFGSGMQTLGALLAVLTVGWCLLRGRALADVAGRGGVVSPLLLMWIRYVVPLAILTVGVWWLLSSVFGIAESV